MSAAATTMTCGRRGDAFSLGAGVEGEDTWRTNARAPVATCSYCGSVKPEDFFAAIEAGSQLTPTDKSYKAYIGIPDPRAGEPRIVSATNHDPREGETGWIAVGDTEREHLQRDGWSNDYAWIRYAPTEADWRGKFYFQHLDDDGKRRLLKLLQDGRINYSYPGHFYVLPYFIRMGA